ncbi:Succinyl-CoA:3-ketoacid coenzyme A transferase subunit A [compost metagenome]
MKARVADRAGNLMFARIARNFNPEVAMTGRMTVVEVEELVEVGELDPDEIHLTDGRSRFKGLARSH